MSSRYDKKGEFDTKSEEYNTKLAVRKRNTRNQYTLTQVLLYANSVSELHKAYGNLLSICGLNTGFKRTANTYINSLVEFEPLDLRGRTEKEKKILPVTEDKTLLWLKKGV